MKAFWKNNIVPPALIGLAAWGFVILVSYNDEPYVLEEKSIESLRMEAEQGDVDSQYRLGFMYGKGDGVQKDLAESLKWMRLAAEQGHAKAQYNMAWFYDEGEVVPEDIPEAMRWQPTPT